MFSKQYAIAFGIKCNFQIWFLVGLVFLQQGTKNTAFSCMLYKRYARILSIFGTKKTIQVCRNYKPSLQI